MDNKLDKYFKDRLYNREFELKDSYWEGAEKLLNAQDRRRRRGFLFWWLGGLAGLFLVIGVIWLIGLNASREQEEANTVMLTEQPLQGTMEKAAADTANFYDSETAAGTQATEKTTVADQTVNTTSGIQTLENKGKTSTSPQASNKSNHFQKPAHTSSTQAVGNTSPGYSPKEPLAVADQAENQLIDDAVTSMKLDSSGIDLEIREQTMLTALDVRQALVSGEFNRPLDLNDHTIQQQKSSPWSFGFLLSQIYQAGAPSDEKTIIGYQGGVVLQYKIRRSWFISSGLLYKYRTGTFEASKSVVALKYSFGKVTNTFILRPKSLHYLSLPLQLGWRKNRHIAEGGMALDYLMGIRGEAGEYKVKEGQAYEREFEASEKGWLVEDGYKKLNTTATLGYRYRVNRQLSFGVQANYTFGGILKKEFDPPVGGYLLKEADKFYLDLRAVYLFK